VLTLLFGLQRLVGWIGDWREQQQQVAELLALSVTQQETQHYPEAWASLTEAERLDASNEDVRRAQEDLVMVWLRAARVRVGEQTFTDLVKPLVPVLERGALRAEGQRKADLLAHAGWADFLRWRDGARDLAVEAHYSRALKSDPGNPFAHAMWGHWILFTGGDVDAARQHFDNALTAGREREYVRHMQLAALLNVSREKGLEELLRLSNEMRLHNEKIGRSEGDKILWLACYSDLYGADSWTASPTRIAPGDEIATLRWLYARSDHEDSRKDMLDFCEARLHALAGDRARALAMLQQLQSDAEGDAMRGHAKRAVDRLAAQGGPT
jgi:tetratricopeptide (TPR) repeat protein